jgi:hypothetical protein
MLAKIIGLFFVITVLFISFLKQKNEVCIIFKKEPFAYKVGGRELEAVFTSKFPAATSPC